MRNKWILGAVLYFLAVTETWSLVEGNNPNSANYRSTTSSTSNMQGVSKLHVYRSEHFRVGSNITLQCSNKTWNEMIYTIWKIPTHEKLCQISSTEDGQNMNTCNDGKALCNTTNGESYLCIPEFSERDEGSYFCETVHKGGSYAAKIDVLVTAPPIVSAWIEKEGSRYTAVCEAVRGKPAASITWRTTWNSSSALITTNFTDGLHSVRSRLVLPEGVAMTNLSCVVSHPSWTDEQTHDPNIATKDYFSDSPKSQIIVISVVTISIVMAVFGSIYFTLRNLHTIRNCFVSNTTPVESKCSPVDEVEEVEPYASYVQRVNTIYNSSDDFFK
ncbi:cell surface glycoprotein CD200 receptor 1-A [Hypomesus transpacificus]|uniref:cell surface glycoprotein CD200 receptor 1-A n=1 Tax=Hypomesus transpacificus TaxID=137520 RepID=UPI001F076F46|nr:cell surface glycoprotein CD200 receptor 1-A [Hypomesus transpacificus]